MKQSLTTMIVLTGAGVVNNGDALINSVEYGPEESVKFLLQQVEGKASGGGSYVNFRDPCGRTPLLSAIGFGMVSVYNIPPPSLRIVWLLVDAGADTASVIPVKDIWTPWGVVVLNETPLALTTCLLREKNVGGKDATEEQLHKLERIRRLLLRVEAVHATSCLWRSKTPFVVLTAKAEATRRTKTASTPFRKMLPLLRRRAGGHRVLVATLLRWVGKVTFYVLGWACDPFVCAYFESA